MKRLRDHRYGARWCLVKTMLRLRRPADMPEAVRTARFAMVSAGYRIRDESETAFTADKGSALSTMFFGWRAGRQLWTIQYVDALVTKEGTAVLEVSRDLTDDLMNEKWIGPPKLQRAFDASVTRIARALSEAGLLA
jgi:hypothetical protein